MSLINSGLKSQPLPASLSELSPSGNPEDYVESGFKGLPSARGNRKGLAELAVEFVRELTPDDLPELLSPSKLPTANVPVVKELKQSHHQLAQLLALKNHSQTEISLITGYSQAYISRILTDPAFQALMAHYAEVREMVYVDVMERMKNLGLDAMEELQKRMAESPESFSIRETQELMELTLVKPMAIAAGANANGNGTKAAPVINISFKAPGIEQSGVVIDAEVVK